MQPDDPFATLLARVQTTVTDATHQQAYPFHRLVEELDVPRALDRQPLFDVMVLLDTADATGLGIADLAVSAFPPDGRVYDVSKFDLTFGFTDAPTGLALGLEYNTALFDPARLVRLADHLHVLVRALLADDTQLVGALPVGTDEERRRLTIEFNDTTTPYPATDDAPSFRGTSAARAETSLHWSATANRSRTAT